MALLTELGIRRAKAKTTVCILKESKINIRKLILSTLLAFTINLLTSTAANTGIYY